MSEQSTEVALAPSDAGALMQIIERLAIEPNFDVAKLQSLLDVRERWAAAEARRAFVTALNAFKANPPRITKNKQVSFSGTNYRHATLDNVCDMIGAALAEHGLSHRWDVQQGDGGVIRVACVLTHLLGHSERVQLEGLPDDSGKKNKIQQVGSTVTYLQRYTLLAITGLATTDQDDDGRRGHEEEVLPDPWTDEIESSAMAAARQGFAAFKHWWQAQSMEFRAAARETQKYADFVAASQQ